MTSTLAGVSIPDSDLCHVQWRSLAWVLEHGPLNESNVMDYFALSPFYDRKSTNQVLRMQSMFSGQPKMDPDSEKEALRRFIGIEYTLVLSRPESDREGGLFVIEKRDRKGYDEFHPIASYYILKASIYQAPSLYATLSARVLASLSSLQQLLELARTYKPVYDSRHSYAWKIKEKAENHAPILDRSPNHGAEESTNETDPSNQLEQERESNMDIDSTAPDDNLNVQRTTRKSSGDTPELSNPILFRALQNTLANFPAFKPTALLNQAPEPLAISTSQAPSPANPTQISAVSSGSSDPSPASAGIASSNAITAQPQVRVDFIPDGVGSPGSTLNKASARSSSQGMSKKKQKKIL